jgi:hypothetical protein
VTFLDCVALDTPPSLDYIQDSVYEAVAHRLLVPGQDITSSLSSGYQDDRLMIDNVLHTQQTSNMAHLGICLARSCRAWPCAKYLRLTATRRMLYLWPSTVAEQKAFMKQMEFSGKEDILVQIRAETR